MSKRDLESTKLDLYNRSAYGALRRAPYPTQSLLMLFCKDNNILVTFLFISIFEPPFRKSCVRACNVRVCQVSCFYHKMHDFPLICWATTPKYQYWFRDILGRFSTHKKIPSETPFHSNLRFLEFFLCKVP